MNGVRSTGWAKELIRSRYDRWASIIAGICLLAIAVHTVFADRRELFYGGARIGELGYDFSIAYAVSYVFYVVVVALPNIRTRQRLRPVVRSGVGTIVGDALSILATIGAPSDTSLGKVTDAEITDWCSTKDLNDGPNRAYLVDGNVIVRRIPVWEAIGERARRTQKSTDRILRLMPFLDAELVSLLDEIENCALMSLVRDSMHVLLSPMRNTNLSSWVNNITDYIEVVQRLEFYNEGM